MSESSPNPVSLHLFLFSFQWDYHAPNTELANTSMLKRTDIRAVHKLMEKDSRWKTFEFDIVEKNEKDYHTFSEYAYFHEFARDILSLNTDKNDFIR